MMRYPRPLLWLGPLLALLLSACSRSDDASSRSAAAAASDPGILKDQSGYTPAKYESLVGGSGGATPAAGGGVEETAVRAVLKDTLAAIGARNVDGVLAAFDPAQIGPLVDQKSALIEAVEKVDNVYRLACRKSPPEACKQLEAWAQKHLPALAEGFVSIMVVELASPTDAFVAPDKAGGEAFAQASIMPALGELPPVLTAFGMDATQAAAFGPTAVAGFQAARGRARELAAQRGGSSEGEPAKLPLRKINDKWVFALPTAMTPQEGEVLRDTLAFVNQAADGLSARLEATEVLNSEAVQAIALQMMMELSPQFMALQQKYAALAGGATPDPNAPDPNKPPEPPPPDAPPTNPRVPGGRAVQP